MGTRETKIAVTCPACHHAGTFAAWDCIDGGETPELRHRILHDDTLFFYECPKCHRQVRIEAPCLYIDRDRKFMVWHLPEQKAPVFADEACQNAGIADAEGYVCRLALTWGEWREKILELESGYDDRLYEIIKYGAYQLIRKEDREKLPVQAYHIDYDSDSSAADALALVFMDQTKKGMGYTYPITARVRDVTSELFQPLLDRLPADEGPKRLYRYNYDWAKQFVEYVMHWASSQDSGTAYRKLLGFWIQTLGKELFQQPVTPRQG